MQNSQKVKISLKISSVWPLELGKPIYFKVLISLLSVSIGEVVKMRLFALLLFCCHGNEINKASILYYQRLITSQNTFQSILWLEPIPGVGAITAEGVGPVFLQYYLHLEMKLFMHELNQFQQLLKLNLN